jgi:hypothetical protein
MRIRLSSRFLTVGAVALAMAAAVAAPAAASPVQDPVPVGPNQYFTGTVNGHPPSQAVVYVVCPGPITPGELGQPLGNQPVEVELATATGAATDIGFTGSAATSIVAAFPASAVTTIIADFTSYYVPAYIPTGIRVPCYGTGAISFIPSPGSATARAATLDVTFVNVAA